MDQIKPSKRVFTQAEAKVDVQQIIDYARIHGYAEVVDADGQRYMTVGMLTHDLPEIDLSE